MKVALVTPYYTPVAGGITTFVKNLERELSARGVDVAVIACEGKAGKGVYLARRKAPSYSKRVYSMLKKIKPDIIHAHAHWYTLLPAILYKFSHGKTKIIFTFHTEPSADIRGMRKRIFERLLSKCECVTFVSGVSQRKIEKNLNIKVEKAVIYPGVSAPEHDKNKTDEFSGRQSIKNRGPVIAFCGPLEWKRKAEGVLRLVKAVKLLSKEYPRIVLIIIGDGRYRKDVEALSGKLGIGRNVIVTGMMEDVYTPLHLADIYAHISLQEGMPLALLEAMSVGKPVIATRAGGIPEVIKSGENGILVETVPEEIASAIAGLYEDKEKMKSIGANALETVRTKFTWKLSADQFLKIYRGETTE